jgi:hypothetical protein
LRLSLYFVSSRERHFKIKGKGDSAMKKMMTLIFVVLLLMCVGSAMANKAAVRIEAPAHAVLGSKVKITLFVTHSANNIFHYTNLVSLKINGKEVARWDYSAFNRPEGADFTRSFEYVMDGPVTLESEAFCNIHGSANSVKASIGL